MIRTFLNHCVRAWLRRPAVNSSNWMMPSGNWIVREVSFPGDAFVPKIFSAINSIAESICLKGFRDFQTRSLRSEATDGRDSSRVREARAFDIIRLD